MLRRAILTTATALLASSPLSPLPATPAAAQQAGGPTTEQVAAAVAADAPAAVAIAHRIHQHPELSNRETETAALVAERLRELGLEVETGIAHTGVVGLLRGGKPGPVVAVRADMDALPVTEATDLPYKSTVRSTLAGQEVGVAHACGHDVHTAVGLGVAQVLAGMRAELPGTVKFIFQPAEEGAPAGERGGAELMLEEGVLDDPRPEAIFALHSAPSIPVGKVGWISGPTWAAVDQFVAILHGRQAHGAAPELSVDPIVMGAEAVLALQTIRSRNLPPAEPAVVTVGIFRGGERFNIIPAEVRLEGTVRTFSPETRATVQQRMQEILDGIAASAGGTADLDYESNAPVTVNDPPLSAWARPALERAVGPDNVLDMHPVMAGEDFAYFAEKVPGFYFRLGTCGQAECSGLHTPTFQADDRAVEVGMRAMAQVVVNYLEGGGAGEGSSGGGGGGR